MSDTEEIFTHDRMNAREFDRSHIATVESGTPQDFSGSVITYAKDKTLLFAARSGLVFLLDPKSLSVPPDFEPSSIVAISNDGESIAVLSQAETTARNLAPRYALQALGDNGLKVAALGDGSTMVAPIGKLTDSFAIVPLDKEGDKISRPFHLMPGDVHQLRLGPDQRLATIDFRLDRSGPVVVIDPYAKPPLTMPFRQDEKDKDRFTLTVGRHEVNGNDYTFDDVHANEGVSRRHAEIIVRRIGKGGEAVCVVRDVSNKNKVQHRRVPASE